MWFTSCPHQLKLVRQLFPVIPVPQRPGTPSWIWEDQTQSSLAFASFFFPFILNKIGWNLVNQDWPKKSSRRMKLDKSFSFWTVENEPAGKLWGFDGEKVDWRPYILDFWVVILANSSQLCGKCVFLYLLIVDRRKCSLWIFSWNKIETKSCRPQLDDYHSNHSCTCNYAISCARYPVANGTEQLTELCFTLFDKKRKNKAE